MVGRWERKRRMAPSCSPVFFLVVFFLILPPASYACVVCARETSPWRRHAPGGGWEHLFCLFCLWVVIRPFLLCKKQEWKRKRKKGEEGRARDQQGNNTWPGETWTGWDGWMDGLFFLAACHRIAAVAIRYLAVGSGERACDNSDDPDNNKSMQMPSAARKGALKIQITNSSNSGDRECSTRKELVAKRARHGWMDGINDPGWETSRTTTTRSRARGIAIATRTPPVVPRQNLGTQGR